MGNLAVVVRRLQSETGFVSPLWADTDVGSPPLCATSGRWKNTNPCFLEDSDVN